MAGKKKKGKKKEKRVVDVASKMTASTGTAIVERAERAGGMADVSAHPLVSLDSCDILGCAPGQRSSARMPNQMRSDTVCVGGWHRHEIKITHILPVAKQTEYKCV